MQNHPTSATLYHLEVKTEVARSQISTWILRLKANFKKPYFIANIDLHLSFVNNHSVVGYYLGMQVISLWNLIRILNIKESEIKEISHIFTNGDVRFT